MTASQASPVAGGNVSEATLGSREEGLSWKAVMDRLSNCHLVDSITLPVPLNKRYATLVLPGSNTRLPAALMRPSLRAAWSSARPRRPCTHRHLSRTLCCRVATNRQRRGSPGLPPGNERQPVSPPRRPLLEPLPRRLPHTPAEHTRARAICRPHPLDAVRRRRWRSRQRGGWSR